MNSESKSSGMYPTWCPICEHRRVTHLEPSPMCAPCWVDNYSTFTMDGVTRPFKEVLKEKLIELDLWFKDGETRGEWQERIEVEGRSALRRYAGREKS